MGIHLMAYAKFIPRWDCSVSLIWVFMHYLHFISQLECLIIPLKVVKKSEFWLTISMPPFSNYWNVR